MAVNRIARYLQAEPMFDDYDAEPQPRQPTFNPGAFAALPLGAIPLFGVQPAPAQPPATMNIYAIALADAQRRLSEPDSADLDFGDF